VPPKDNKNPATRPDSAEGHTRDKPIRLRKNHALKICADKMRRHKVRRMRVIATEACRRASNGEEFINRVKQETGLRLSVIRPEEEARLAVAGCAPLLDPECESILVFDIGGGSTELILVDLHGTPPHLRQKLLMALAPNSGEPERARAAAAHIADWISLPVGVVTLAEKYAMVHDEIERFQLMAGEVASLIAPFAVNACEATPERLSKMQLLGTSGTITTLAGVHLELEQYNRAKVDGLWVDISAIDRVIDKLLCLNPYERAAMPCIGEDRAELVMSGAAILRAILRAWPAPKLRVADRGLREGMLYGLMNSEGHQKQKNKR